MLVLMLVGGGDTRMVLFARVNEAQAGLASGHHGEELLRVDQLDMGIGAASDASL